MAAPSLKYICDDKRHLICLPYSIANLHLMARRLKIGRHWFHRGNFPHYDIPKRRYEAVQARCFIIVDDRAILRLIKAAKAEGLC